MKLICSNTNTTPFKNMIEFESEEEIDIYCQFFHKNDYFIQKSYPRIEDYKSYIKNIPNGKLHTDNEYHFRLSFELKTIVQNTIRRRKIIQLRKKKPFEM